mgnify:CR=1 FL=1
MAEQKSDLSRAFSEDGALKTHVGGQALIEGIMMRGKYNWAAAVREPAGTIYVEEHDLASGRSKNKWLYWPIVRGCRAFVESLVLGYKALEVAALHAFSDSEPAKASPMDAAEQAVPAEEAAALSTVDFSGDDSDEKADDSFEFGKKEMAFSMVLGLVLGVALFIIAPAVIANLLVGEYDSNTLAWNIVDGIVRVAIFVFYIWLIGRMEDIKRMFGYHGAEHKTIFCYEAGLPLTVENVRRQSRQHPRCGTSFLFVVIVVAILLSSFVFSFVEVTNVFARMGVHLLLLPVVVSLTYEINRLVGRYDNALTRVMTAPGLWLQNYTTFEPVDSMIEVGIRALELVLPEKQGEDAW